MAEPSPSERELARGTLVLHPDGEPDERLIVSPGVVASRPELQVQVLLRDVRDAAQPVETRRGWLDRACVLARPLSRLGWYTLHLAFVRHAMLVGDQLGARDRANELLIQMLDKPGPEVTDHDSTLRDALRRAVLALRVPILARTIKLDLGDPLSRIMETARSDRTLDDKSRVEVLFRLLAGLVALDADATPALEMLRATGSSATRAVPGDPVALKTWMKKQREHNRPFVRERAKNYKAEPIYEWDRLPDELRWKRINGGRLD